MASLRLCAHCKRPVNVLTMPCVIYPNHDVDDGSKDKVLHTDCFNELVRKLGSAGAVDGSIAKS